MRLGSRPASPSRRHDLLRPGRRHAAVRPCPGRAQRWGNGGRRRRPPPRRHRALEWITPSATVNRRRLRGVRAGLPTGAGHRAEGLLGRQSSRRRAALCTAPIAMCGWQAMSTPPGGPSPLRPRGVHTCGRAAPCPAEAPRRPQPGLLRGGKQLYGEKFWRPHSASSPLSLDSTYHLWTGWPQHCATEKWNRIRKS